MIGTFFSKTKNLDKIHSAYLEQYNNISEAIEKFHLEEEHLDYKHGIKMFGNVKDILQEQINDGLEDLKTNVIHDFANGDYVVVNDTSFGPDRFVLHFSDAQNVSLENPDLLNWYAYAVDGGLVIKAPESENATIEIYDMASRLIAKKSGFSRETSISLKSSGVHIIRLIESNKISNFKIILQ